MRRGFALIELLIVLVIIATLTLLAIPAISSYRANARTAAVQSDLRNAGTEMESARAATGAYPTSLDGIRTSSGVVLALASHDGALCIDGHHTASTDEWRYVTDAGVQRGRCNTPGLPSTTSPPTASNPPAAPVVASAARTVGGSCAELAVVSVPADVTGYTGEVGPSLAALSPATPASTVDHATGTAVVTLCGLDPVAAYVVVLRAVGAGESVGSLPVSV